MAAVTVNTQAVSATSAVNVFVAAEFSGGGVSGRVPYALLTDGATLSGTGAFQLYGALPPVAISGTALVSVTNQIDASVHGQVSAYITNTPIVIARHATDTIYDGTTALTPRFATFGVNTSGAATIISKVAARKLRILNLVAVCEGAVGFYFRDDGTKILMGDATDLMEFGANGGFVLPYSPVGWCETSSSSSFQIVPDTATSIAGSITYVEV